MLWFGLDKQLSTLVLNFNNIFLLTIKKNNMSNDKKISDVQKMIGEFAPKLAEYTDNVLFGDVWQGKELTPRDRSLITVSALVTGEHSGQLKYHLNRAKDNGLTEAELVGVITHLAFYTGWPRAMTAIMIAKEVFENER